MILGLLRAMATPILPKSPLGRPSSAVIFFQVLPPSCVICSPLPSPPELKNQGSLLCSHMAAINLLGFVGSMTKSATPVLLFTNKTFSQVSPPSVVLKTPRSGCSPQGEPIAPTYTISGFVGSIITLWMCRVFSSPMDFQDLPPSKDLYIPYPPFKLFLGFPSPVPTQITDGLDC